MQADLTDFDLGRSFDVVVMAGNVPLFTPPGTHAALVAGCARHVARAGVLVAGFQLGRGYSLADYDAHCRAAGLELADRYATWDGDGFSDASEYAVSVHRPLPADKWRRTTRIRPGDRASARCDSGRASCILDVTVRPEEFSWPAPSPVGPLRPSASAKPALPTSRRSAAPSHARSPTTRCSSWVIPDESRRRRLLPALFALFANAVRHHDAMYIAGGAVAAAIWVPAGQPAMEESDGEAFGGAHRGRVRSRREPRVFEISAAMEAQHPAEPHEYLWFLGVQPAWQGNGIGAAMMTPVLAQCDIDGKAAYLEATSPANVRLYERHGFDVTGVIDAHGGAPLYPMWRDPLAF